jgi:hypothetical protein
MKTEQAIQVLRDYNLWRRGDDVMEQPDPREIGKAIDDAIEAMEELNEWKTLISWGGTPEIINDFIKGQQSRIYAAQKAEAERDLWRAEAQRWREQALDLEDQIETAIKRIQWRQDNLDRGIKELKSGY